MKKTLIGLLYLIACTAYGASFIVSWTDNSTNENGFILERKTGNGAFIKIATTPTDEAVYIDKNLPLNTEFTYRVLAFNAGGYSEYSNTVTGKTPLTEPVVTKPNAPSVTVLKIPGDIVNISTRSDIVTSDPLIGGFVIRNGYVNVLVRGVGPELGDFGIPNFMVDPMIVLFRNGVEIARNDNWSNVGADVATKVGAVPLKAGSKSAALLWECAPGEYTVHVTGVGGVTGVALVEVYKAD